VPTTRPVAPDCSLRDHSTVSLRAFGLLLAGWVVAVVIPGLVAATAWDINTDSTNLGGPFGVWIVAYLVQLGLFMTASRRSKKNNVLAWIVASLLPWVSDWATVAARWAVAPCAAVAILIAWRMYRSTASSEHLAQSGVPATGTVLEVIKPKLMNVVINNVYILRKLRLRIERVDGVESYEAVLKGTFMLGEIPDVGDTMSLRIDPHNPMHFEAVDGTSSVPTKGSAEAHSADGSVTDQLERLGHLRASGSLTDEEFAQAKARVLGS
jgi:Short C-terminal domain